MRGEGAHACAAHLHPSLYLAARCCLGTATQTRTIACTHLHAYYDAHKYGMQALARTPPRRRQRHARGTYPVPCRNVGAVLQQRLHHRSMPASGGIVQAGAPALESRRAVSGGATATRAASAGGDALPRRAPCTPDTHQRKHTAAGGRMGALPCYAPSTPMHAHTALTARHSRIRLCIQERCCLGTATQTRTIACTHLHAYHGAHTHGMQALARTPPRRRPRHLPPPSPPRRRRAVAASAPPQHARTRRLGASWCSRTGEQACGQRRGNSD